MTRQTFRRVVALLIFVLSANVWAQVSTGSISGTVADGAGAVIPNTQIVISQEETGIARTLTTDTNGHYSAPSLGVGSYRVTVKRQGFREEIRSGIVVTVGREAVVNMALGVGSVTEVIEVQGEAPLVDTTTASVGSLVSGKEIRQLPLNGRSYDQLALLEPGVVATSPGNPSTTGGYSFGTGKRFSVGGQRNGTNNFLMDGMNINDQANGTPGGAAGTNLGVDTIEEFRILTNSYKAEFGHSSGAVITAVTRSGTNRYHGTAFEYIRNSAFDARNYFDVGKQPPSFRRNQFGGVLGGPIRKNKLFFFTGYEGLRQGLATTQTAAVPTALTRQGILPVAAGSSQTTTVVVNPVIIPYLNLYPLPNGQDNGDGTGAYISSPLSPTNEDNVMGRVDYQINPRFSMFGRYMYDNDSQFAPLSLPNLFVNAASRRQYLTLQFVNIISNQAVNNFRVGYNRSVSRSDQAFNPDPGAALAIIPGQKLGTLQIGGISSSGGRALTPLGPNSGQGVNFWAFNLYQYSDDFSITKRKHSFKFGADIQRLLDNTVLSGPVRGSYTFSSLPNFLLGKPSNLQSAAPLGSNPEFGYRQTGMAFYAQDDYTLSARLTLLLGLRWEATTDPIDVNGKNVYLASPSDAQLVPGPFTKIGKNNWEPRLGLAWTLDGSGKTVLHVGGGIYHNQVLPWVYSFRTRVPPFAGVYNAPNPSFPDGWKQLVPGTTPIGLQISAPYSATPTVYQYNMSVQREFLKGTVAQISYIGNRSTHVPMQFEMNTPVPQIVNGQPVYPAGALRQNTAWSSIRETFMSANGSYNALVASVRRQSAKGLTGQAFYTFSKSLDTNSTLGQSESSRSPAIVMDPRNPRRDWALSDYDTRHVFVASLSYLIPTRIEQPVVGFFTNGWTVSSIATLSAGMPFTVLNPSAISRDGGTTLAERPNLKPGYSNNPTSGVSAGCTGFAAGIPVRTAKNWYDPCAFSLPAAGTYGNLGRNTLIGPGLASVDMSLQKGFKPREGLMVNFRAEMFNAMNHTNLGLPNPTPVAASGSANATAGQNLYTATSARQLQFALRINF